MPDDLFSPVSDNKKDVAIELTSGDKYYSAFEKELAKLNTEQKKAVEKIEGPVMVIAGPGTGKTQIIAARIGNILKSDTQAAPHNILCLTYTDAGTVAMRNRLINFIGPTAYRVNIYTFHAFCNEIIQHNPDYFGKRELEPISELENIQLLQQLLNSLPSNHLLKRLKGDIYYDVSRMKNLFGKMKEEDWTPELVNEMIDDYLNDLPNRDEFIYKTSNSKKGYVKGDLKQNDIDKEKEKMEKLRAAAFLFPEYQKMMMELNRYDYSDMLLWVLNAFKKDENFLRGYQEWYQYFLVDEYQDTSGSQNELLQKLIDFWEKPNVFVVGDDDQCIYEFQGARVKNMVSLLEKYEKDIEVVVLKENYRSTQVILDGAKAVISNNQQRLINQQSLLEKIPGITKSLSAANTEMMDSKIQPKILQYYNIQHEEFSIVEEIERLKKQNIPLQETAIIYYQHKQASNIIDLLQKKNIPYNVRKQINILDLPIISQVITILKYLQSEHESPNSGEHLLFGIMHFRFFKISTRDISRLAGFISLINDQKRFKKEPRVSWREFLANKIELQNLKTENISAIIKFETVMTNLLSEVPNLTLAMLSEKVLNWTGLLASILDAPDKIWNLQVVNTFFDFVKNECAKHPRMTITDFLKMMDDMMENRIHLSVNKTVFEENGVNFITCHSAKGLEFRYVFLIGCTKDIWESSRGNMNSFSLPDTITFSSKEDENKMESSRRLFYVAMTRAKEYLQISFAGKTNEGKSLERTRFIEEISAGTDLKCAESYLPNEKIATYTSELLTEKIQLPSEILDKEFIKTRLEEYKLSVSDLNLYLDCPISFYYQRILKVPAAKSESLAFGIAIHSALKKLFDKMNISPNKQFPLKEEFVNDFRIALTKEKDGLTEQQFKNRIGLGEKILPEYYDKYVKEWNKIIVSEYSIGNIEIEGVPITGRIDKIEFNGKEVNMVDYKTGKIDYALPKLKSPDEKNPEGGDYWRQIVFYQILMDNNKRKDWKMISGEFDFIEKDEKKKGFIKVRLQVAKEEVHIVKSQIKTVYQKIMNHEFSEGCGDKDCEWCVFVKNNLNELPLEKIIVEE